MANKNEQERIELKSVEVQEILGYIPHWVIRSGIGVILCTLMVLLVGSYFFKYPHVITSPIEIISENPPAHLKTAIGGKIDQILVNDEDSVKAGQVIAVIESSASYKDILKLEEALKTANKCILSTDTSCINELEGNYYLGNIQAFYAQFIKSYKDYYNFIILNYHSQKQRAVQEHITQIKQSIEGLKNQVRIINTELSISQKQFKRDSVLFLQNIIPESEFENSKVSFLNKKYEYEQVKSGVINRNIELNNLKQTLLELDISYQKEKHNHVLQIKANYEQIVSQIEQWKLSYMYISPMNGKVSFTNIWSKNQNINNGEVAFTIVPHEATSIVGKVQLAITGSGKVKEGQKVNIKLENYPYMEYGILQGKVTSIALAPANNYYLLTVELPQSLITNYNKPLLFSQQMKGSAEIITEDLSVLQRMLQPLHSAIKNNR